MRWATADEVVERYPVLTRDDLTALAALGRLAWRSEPVFAAGRFTGAAVLYDIGGIQVLLAEDAVTELRAAGARSLT